MRSVIKPTMKTKQSGGCLPAILAGLIFTCRVACGINFVVTTTADNVAGSLRQAINNANASPGQNTISFQISGTAPFIIAPSSPLPPIANQTTIDATTQPGYVNTPVVVLNGASSGSGSIGLQLNSAFCTVKGLVINQFSVQGMVLNSVSNVIQGNYIGTDATGTSTSGNGDVGLWIKSAGNLIGGTNAGNGNLISGGNKSGIYILSGGNNTIQGNWIGLGAGGTGALGNNNYGILINGSGGNLVGGAVPAARNILSGNGVSGIYLTGGGAAGNLIQGNYVGTDVSGGIAVGNAADGITVIGAPGNLINSNVISGNGEFGVSVSGGGAVSNVITGNNVGTDVTGKLALGNAGNGVILFSGAGQNWIGGTNAGAGNLISGNVQNGVALVGGANQNVIQGNLIGLSAAGTSALANGYNGVSLNGASSNLIGGTVAAAHNVISGNGYNGVGILLVTDVLNTVAGNFIGTDLTGTKAIGNVLAGVRIQACSNLVGGVTAASGNVISGNGQQGIFLVGINGNAIGNVVQGNLIGLNAAGANSLGNGNVGIGISSAAASQIGGAAAGARNVISGNGNNGIFLLGAGTAANVIQGNYIGTDQTGTLARGNVQDAIFVQDANNNQIGGSAAGAGNLLSGNNANGGNSGNNGIYLTNASWNFIQGNRIGTDVSGTSNLGNSWNAIYMQNANSNQIGGAVAGAGNLLSANGREGIDLVSASGNVIQGNFIGTKADGTNALGNALHGIDLDVGSTNNTVGGTATGAGNHIAFTQTSLYSGVRVRNGATNDLISANSIFSNAELGIDLGTYGVTPNLDCESGVAANAANAGQNFPVITNVGSGSITRVRGTFDSAPNRTYLLQFFASAKGNSLNYGEGQLFLGGPTLPWEVCAHRISPPSCQHRCPMAGWSRRPLPTRPITLLNFQPGQMRV